ncbi:MAG: DNA polymerase/3'-5' exonuclease PolX [Acidobacteria bacterium]|nr:DNA polymerase/3'-5' exonuclease PolX [Acidobacteriota bacterium]
MDNKSIAGILYETAELLEIEGADSFRIRSYRNAAEAVEAWPQQLSDLISEPRQVLAIPGIGKGMLAHLEEMLREGRLSLHADLLKKYRPSMLELLRVQGLGPKTISLIWSAYQVCDLEAVEKLAREGKLRILPRMGEKQEQKLLKAIEDYRRIAGRFLLDTAEKEAAKIVEHLGRYPGVEKATPAGSLRRGRETVGDLDILVTGPACANDGERQKLVEHIIQLPGLMQILARGENKVSFRLRGGLQVDIRFLPPDSFGAAMQYFTGSKTHNVALRQRALKMGYTLNEYSLARLDDQQVVASESEQAVYAALKLDYIPPEMRENCGEIEAAENHALPRLIADGEIQGDVHMHTVETDGRNTIEEMVDAARARGYRYLAITDHSKNLAFANGLDDRRALEHMERIRNVDKASDGIRIFAGIEVDILADGSLDLSNSVLEQMDVVIASVHSHFNQSAEEMTARLLKALENPHVSFLGHPTGRILLRRDAYGFDMEAILAAAARYKVAMELNAYPDRLDLSDRHLRMARQRGVKIVINTDSHHTTHLEKIRFGILQARRAWLTAADVLNTLPAAEFAMAMKHAWPKG